MTRLWRSSFRPGFGILFTGSTPESVKELAGWDRTVTSLGVRLQTVNDGHSVAMATSPGRYLCAVPRSPDEILGKVVFGREEVKDWETFRLHEVATPEMPAFNEKLCRVAEALLLQPLGGRRAYNFLRSFVLDCYGLSVPSLIGESSDERSSALELTTFNRQQFAKDAANLLLAFLSPSDWEELSRCVSRDWDELKEPLSSLFDDPWLEFGLSGLNNALPYQHSIDIDPSLDSIQKAGYSGSHASFGHALNAATRRLRRPKLTTSIVATARNEGLYLVEWVAYHREIGFEDIFIYSNNNTDGSDDLLRALAAKGEIKWINNHIAPTSFPQEKAYSHAFSILPDILNFKWTLVIDLDEFFVIDRSRFGNVQSYLDWQETRPVDAIGVNWLMYGSDSHANWDRRPLVHRFTRPSEPVSHTIKSFVRPHLFLNSHPHFPVTDLATSVFYRDSLGQQHSYIPSSGSTAATTVAATETAWVAHYAYKSLDEYLWKASRNTGNQPPSESLYGNKLPQRSVDGFTSQFRLKGPEDLRASECVSSLDNKIVDLMSNASISDAVLAIQGFYNRTIPDLRLRYRDEISRYALY